MEKSYLPPRQRKPSVLNIFPIHGHTSRDIDNMFTSKNEYEHKYVRENPIGEK